MPARKIDPVKAPPVPLSEFIGVVFRHYDGASGYLQREIRSALLDRGLYRHETKRRLGILSREDDVPSPAGERAKAELERRLEMASQMPEWARGVAFAGLLGAAALLFETAYPDLQRLSGQLGEAAAAAPARAEPDPPLPPEFQLLGLPSGEEPPGGGQSSALVPAAEQAEAGGTPPARVAVGAAGVASPAGRLPPALAGLDLAAAMSLDLDAINLDGRDAAVKAIDAAVDAAAGEADGGR